MSTELLTILPNLSIGVISVGALVFVTIKFLMHLDTRANSHEIAMKERESALREVEREVRVTILNQLSKNTEVLNDTVKTLERFTSILNNK